VSPPLWLATIATIATSFMKLFIYLFIYYFYKRYGKHGKYSQSVEFIGVQAARGTGKIRQQWQVLPETCAQ